MAIKDIDSSENKDLEKKPSTLLVEETKDDAADEVKNAHATGDGSFGRNDSSLTDEEEIEKKAAPNY